LNDSAINTAGAIAKNTAGAYLEHGVLGATVVSLFLISAILLYLLLKNNSDKHLMEQMEQNEKEFIAMYKNNIEHNKNMVALLTEALEMERQNSKSCYKELGDKIDKINLNFEKITMMAKANG